MKRKYLPSLFLILLTTNSASSKEDNSSIKLDYQNKGKITVTINNKPFTTYHYSKDRAKPVLYPILGPSGKRMVRDWPLKKDSPNEAHDHPHHESLWYSHGDVNGISFWHVGEKMGKIRHKEFIKKGKNEIITKNDWYSPKGIVQCSDKTRIRFLALPNGGRGVDYEVTIVASNGDVKFGDTKEGSMGIRTHPALRLKGDVATGKAINNNGVSGKSIWGKPAKWLYYWGKIEDAEVGIGIFDHPSNPRHPTTWHARDYGLIAANPFGYSHFQGKPRGTGDLILKDGEKITFRYAFVFLSGDNKKSGVDDIYTKWGFSDAQF